MNARISVVTLLVAGSLALAGANAPAAQHTSSRTKVSFDLTFVTKAAQAGLTEVDEGEIAARKGENSAVRDFGQKMVDDHSKANDELKTLAQEKNITLPAEQTAAQKAAIGKLNRLSGSAFDATYTRNAKADHLQAIKLFEDEIKKGADPELKAFANKTLPTIRGHYKMLQNLNALGKMSPNKM